MENDIRHLEPKALWKHFHSLARIPRPSGHEDQVREFIAAFGRSLGLDTLVDECGNVIIRKPASAGMEDCRGVILQAHLDMVPQKNSGKQHDFLHDPVEAVIDGEWVRACGTTLGADNGIGVAAIMAVLESDTLRHGPLEALFTTGEETGMKGATGLQPGLLRGDMLMNLDSEEEGELFIGCAGGVNGTARFSYRGETLRGGYAGFSITVSGLRGGHSGMDIHLGRGNANKIMNRVLFEAQARHGLLLGTIEGGTLRNAIPRESAATVAVPEANASGFSETVAMLEATIRSELSAADSGLRIEASSAAAPERVIEEPVFTRLLNAIYACPDGVMRMSSEMEGLVETSSNLAAVRSGDGAVSVQCLLRSSVDSSRENLSRMIGCVFYLAGVDTVFDGGYPGWKPDPGSPLLGYLREAYREKFSVAPKVQTVHAGQECGIIGGSYPALDMISFGPTIRYPHSPDEKVEIASVGKFWEFLTEALLRVPAAHS